MTTNIARKYLIEAINHMALIDGNDKEADNHREEALYLLDEVRHHIERTGRESRKRGMKE